MNEDLTPKEREELELLRKEKAMREKGGLTLKVSQKGALSLYGLGRFPVTLYKEQWEKILTYTETIRTFMDEHKQELKTKERT